MSECYFCGGIARWPGSQLCHACARAFTEHDVHTKRAMADWLRAQQQGETR